MEADAHLTMPREEVRARLNACAKIFPKEAMRKILGINNIDLQNFMKDRPARYRAGIGPARLRKIAKLCLEIETGLWEWNGGKTKNSRVWRNEEPKRRAAPIHRVMFQSGKAVLSQGAAPKVSNMPSFKALFGSKGIPLPFVGKSGK
jgi:hypothetical protein